MSIKVTACRSCGAPIVFIKTKAGKSMPCNAAPIPYRAKAGGDLKIVTEEGDVVCCERLTDKTKGSGWGYVPHWATCNAPDSFRKKEGKTT